MTERAILKITGTDREHFLQGLITNDLAKAGDGLIYAALLTPQGKYLADFFVLAEPEAILIDVDAALAAGPGAAAGHVSAAGRCADHTDRSWCQPRHRAGPGRQPLPDPRHPALGWRLYGPGATDDGTDWDALRVAHLIPQTGIELTPESYILEAGFERLNGVDFRKGCYVGQEVTARMKHKTELKKGLARVRVEGPAACGDPILSDGREIGQVLTRAGDRAIAYLRLDRAGGEMRAGAARVTRED